jgi:hypothetical protein
MPSCRGQRRNSQFYRRRDADTLTCVGIAEIDPLPTEADAAAALNAVDALLVGYHEGRKLKFAGKVKAAFVAHTRRELFQRLQPIQLEQFPV